MANMYTDDREEAMPRKYGPQPKWRRNAQPHQGLTEVATFRMTPDERSLLKSLAADEFVSMNTLARRAIQAYAEHRPHHTQTPAESDQISA